MISQCMLESCFLTVTVILYKCIQSLDDLLVFSQRKQSIILSLPLHNLIMQHHIVMNHTQHKVPRYRALPDQEESLSEACSSEDNLRLFPGESPVEPVLIRQ